MSSYHGYETNKNHHADGRSSMLEPFAYDETIMPALKLARSSRMARRIAKVLLVLLVIMLVLMCFAPWQQSVTGSGDVIAFAPDQREQTIEAPIKGRIVRWGSNIYENALVQKGQMIAEVKDLDEEYADRLDKQLENLNQAVTAAEDQLEGKKLALEAANTVIESQIQRVEGYKRVKAETILAQDNYVAEAEQKVLAEQQTLAEYKAGLPQIEQEEERTRNLHKLGNISLQKLQEIQRKLGEQRAKIARAAAYVEAAEKLLAGKRHERESKIFKAQVDIDYAQGELDKSKSEASKLQSDVAKAQQELNKAKKDVLEMETKVARQQTQTLTAPFEGYIVEINPNFATKVLKEGDPICRIVPKTADRAVQIWLNGNDAPLVEPGRHVRLQFEGWPAVQFAGWPSVAVGTFGGEVISVDATDNGKSKFRILIRPDPDDEPWPEERFLRQGVRANGWVLLEVVPLWYEAWRRLNGFPPAINMEGEEDKNKSKPPKIPK